MDKYDEISLQYSPPFDDEHYDMVPENWRVCI